MSFPVADLLERARLGDEAAWNSLILEYQNIVWAATVSFRFDEATRQDVFQFTWLALLDNLDKIRDPARLPGWLKTTAHRECINVARAQSRFVLEDGSELVDEPSSSDDIDLRLLEEERHLAIAEAFNELDESCRKLLGLLATNPPLSYDEVAAEFVDDHGVIRKRNWVGPTRTRCINKLRARPAFARITFEGSTSEDQETSRDV